MRLSVRERMILSRLVRAVGDRFGVEITRSTRRAPNLLDMPAAFFELWEAVKPFTMTSPERGFALYEAIRYVERFKVPGAIVECGVWRGGSAMLAALTLEQIGAVPRDIYLFDTFSGMTEPTAEDIAVDGRSASSLLEASSADSTFRGVAPLEVVQSNFAKLDYPRKHVHFVEGLVEDTLPAAAPTEIAVLRLDTDWYRSTKHELEHLVPHVAPGGVILIDDYGVWQGARKAVDEYLNETSLPILLNRVDHTGRIGVMPHMRST